MSLKLQGFVHVQEHPQPEHLPLACPAPPQQAVPILPHVTEPEVVFRSSVDAIQQAERLRERGIEFQIVSLGVDTSTADGMLVYTVIAAMAEHERKRLSERTKQGLEAVRRRGQRLGRPPKLTARQVTAAIRQIDTGGASVAEVAAMNDVHPWTLTRAIRRLDSD